MRTINIEPVTAPNGSVDFHVWESRGWWSCRSGIYNGLYSESDDLGPFETEQEALNEQKIDYENCLKTNERYDNLFVDNFNT